MIIIWEKYDLSQQYGTILRLSWGKKQKKTVLTAARCRKNWPNWLITSFSKKSTAVTAVVCFENYLRKLCFFTVIRHSYTTLVIKKNTALTAARCRENWLPWLVNKILVKKSMALTAAGCRENKERKVYFFTVIRQGYKTLLRKKKTHHSRQQGAVRIFPTDKSITLDKKSTKLTAAVCCENYLRKACFFTAIRHNYKTLVSKKNKGTHGSKVPWELADLTSQ